MAQGFVEAAARFNFHLLKLLRRDHALVDEPLRVEIANRGLGGDFAGHQRLGEARLVLLVVAVLAIAPQIDHDVAVELLAECDRQLRRVKTRLGVIPVHVEDRRLNHLGHVRGVGRETSLARQGGEADLVVDDDVDGSAGAIVGQFRQAEGFMHDSLPAEGGVAVDEDRRHADSRRVIASIILLGPHDPHDHGIHQFQVAGVIAQRDVDAVIAFGLAILGISQVIFDVTVAVEMLGSAALEFAEDGFIGLVDDVGQHVEPAAMGHSHHHFQDAQGRPVVHEGIEKGDEGFGAFDAEAFLARLLQGQEILKPLGHDQLVQKRLPLRTGQDGTVEDRLHSLNQPFALGLVGNAREFDAERAAIGGVQAFDQIAKGSVKRAFKIAMSDPLVHVRGGQVELRKVQ